MSFYLSLFIFIISLIAGLALMIAGKGMSRPKFFLLVSIHSIFIFLFIVSLLLSKPTNNGGYNYFFTAFICSGLILSGIVWRCESPFILKIYFSLFALTIPLFMLSPSVLLSFLLTTSFENSGEKNFHLRDKYFLEQQNSTRGTDTIPHYKVILLKGIFHKTIQRDLVFGGKLDSVKIINDYRDSLLIRGYTGKSSYVSEEIDSVDKKVNLIIIKHDDLEYHL